MNFQVIYTLEREQHKVLHKADWICPSGYTIEQALQSFKEGNTSATVISIRPLTELPTPDTNATDR